MSNRSPPQDEDGVPDLLLALSKSHSILGCSVWTTSLGLHTHVGQDSVVPWNMNFKFFVL